jgi:hypothetical protein
MIGPFATATEFCEFTGIPIPSDLSRLQSQLLMASSVMRSYCDQTLSFVTGDQITVYPTASTFLSLPERPVTEVDGVLVDGAPFTAYYIVPRGLRSGSVASPGSAWTRGATVTYSHGYAETDPQFSVLRTICIESAARAFTMNERSASEAMGSTLMESAGYSPEVFLTQGEKQTLREFRRGPVR